MVCWHEKVTGGSELRNGGGGHDAPVECSIPSSRPVEDTFDTNLPHHPNPQRAKDETTSKTTSEPCGATYTTPSNLGDYDIRHDSRVYVSSVLRFLDCVPVLSFGYVARRDDVYMYVV